MTLRTLFTINVPISVVFGSTCLFVPDWLLSLYGVDITAAGRSMTQLAGAAYLGFAVLAFVARTSPSEDFVRALALALLIQDSIGTVVSTYGQGAGIFNWFGWSTVAVFASLALGYGYLLLPKQRVAAGA